MILAQAVQKKTKEIIEGDQIFAPNILVRKWDIGRTGSILLQENNRSFQVFGDGVRRENILGDGKIYCVINLCYSLP